MNIFQTCLHIGLVEAVDAQHRAGILARRRDSTQIYYRLQSERVATLCRAVCTQMALEMDNSAELPDEERLLPPRRRRRWRTRCAASSATPPVARRPPAWVAAA